MGTSPASINLLDEIKQARTAGCKLTLVLEQLSTEDAAGLTTALGDMKIKSTTIGDVLRRRGFELSDDTVQRHRRGKCGCSRG